MKYKSSPLVLPEERIDYCTNLLRLKVGVLDFRAEARASLIGEGVVTDDKGARKGFVELFE